MRAEEVGEGGLQDLADNLDRLVESSLTRESSAQKHVPSDVAARSASSALSAKACTA